MWIIFKVFIEFVTILFLFLYFGFWPRGMPDLSSQTRDQTLTPSTGRRSLNHWTIREVHPLPTPAMHVYAYAQWAPPPYTHTHTHTHTPGPSQFPQVPSGFSQDHHNSQSTTSLLWIGVRETISQVSNSLLFYFIFFNIMGYPGGLAIENPLTMQETHET